ncbi:antitoxin Xre/MbcA/ParS toxin-binding domain-containing protein [Polymorphobacter sp.]|uniref:antitoxin Xre/MbcA/ParS toxin-binding domain-containing protein n=1 Tax=Polymorphobacter sp. TaxID=1909290 RepID=UPI003F70809A
MTVAIKDRKRADEGSAGFVTSFIDKGGIVDVERVADRFRMTKGQLAETIGLGAATVSKADRRAAPRTQSRVREMLEIVARVRDWAGGETQAMAWYRSQPIPALDGRTPEALVKAGEAGAVRDYLDHLALGGFA